MSDDAPARIASTMMLVREAPAVEVLMVKRNQAIDHFSGAMLFPGGKVEPSDLDPAWRAQVEGWDDIPESERGPRISAIRETFEECGILPAVQGYRASPGDTMALRAAIGSGRGQLSGLSSAAGAAARPALAVAVCALAHPAGGGQALRYVSISSRPRPSRWRRPTGEKRSWSNGSPPPPRWTWRREASGPSSFPPG